MGMPLTATLSADQRAANRAAKSMQDGDPLKVVNLIVQDEGLVPQYVIYVYNVLGIPHTRHMPPNFPSFYIPPCLSGDKFSFTVLPAFVRNKFNRPGTTEYYWQREDGRRSASQLLNPGSFPGISWDAQLQDNISLALDKAQENWGNNLHAFGCFWSLTRPDDPALERELKIFSDRARRTMNELIKEANMLDASVNARGHSRKGEISPMMHFAADYLHVRAPWHTSHEHMVSCPNCGEPVIAGIAYHRNSFNEKCIVDPVKCRAIGILPPEEVPAVEEPVETAGAQDEEAGLPDEDEILALAQKIMAERRKKADAARRLAKAAKPPEKG